MPLVSVHRAACKSVQRGFSHFSLLIFAPTASPMVLYICVESSRVFNAGQGCVLELVPSGATTIIALFLLDMGTGLYREVCRIIIPVIFPPMGRAPLQQKLSSSGEEM